ncbi:MAG: hypothetical protein ACO3RV_02700 [Luteolibacter sp.]
MKKPIYTAIILCLAALSLNANPKLAGEWTTSYGRYEEILTLKPDGSFTRVVNSVRGPESDQAKGNPSTGKWRMVGNKLELTDKHGPELGTLNMISENVFEYPSFMGPDDMLTYERTQAVVNAEAKLTEPKIGSPERKAIMDAMRGPVSQYAGTEVIFTGSCQVYGEWAKLSGNVNPKNGKRFKEEVEDECSLDFLAVLRKVGGKWELKYYGWAGDIGIYQMAREQVPDVPEILIPIIPN